MRSFILILGLIFQIQLAAQPYQPDWESLDNRAVPEWWREAKFGIFIHWGPYSVPAYAPVDEVEGIYEKYAEHYENRLINRNEHFLGHHETYYGKDYPYRNFGKLFNAKYFEPKQWAKLFNESGAKYVVLTSKHHDGYCLWPSAQSPGWNSVEAGSERDLAGELSEAVRDEGMRMGFYYSFLEWSHPLYSPKTIDKYVSEHMLPQMKDLVNSYKPEIIFADGEWDYSSKQFKSEAFLSWLYNDSPVRESVVVNDRWGSDTRGKHGGYYTTEYDLGAELLELDGSGVHPWEESRGIGTSYGFNKFERAEHYVSAEELVHLLIKKVSQGGNLLLNVGPTSEGLIPVIMQERLLAMGSWLDTNGEAIFGSTVWENRFDDNEDHVFFTKKGHDLYVICTEWPQQSITVKSVSTVDRVYLLGSNAVVDYKTDNNTITIKAPDLGQNRLPTKYAWVFKLENFR